MTTRNFLCTLLIAFLFFSCDDQNKTRLLVFSKTEGYRHESIEAGKAALQKMSEEKGFEAVFTEDSDMFNERELKNYKAVVFLNTTGDVLNADQQIAFERFIQAGGGYVGIHAATDTEYNWPWYGALAGAYFLDHPSDPSNVQKGTFHVAEKDHWATKGMPDNFEREDEFYSFRNISDRINVVLTIDDDSYIGGSNPDYHPMSWYQEYDGGKAFYTAMGHTNETYSEQLFLDHLWAGIHYVTGGDEPKPLDYALARPEENRFTKIVLADKLDEPMELTRLDDKRILFIQRKGEVRLYNLETQELKTIAKIPVSLYYVNKEGEEAVAEDGLLGLNKDPQFAYNNWIYLYYSSTEGSKNVLSRFTMDGDKLLMDSEIVMLEVPVQREECCHTGGSIAWDSEGNLYLSTGDNTNPHDSNGYSPSDERPGRGPWDAQKSSANTNDLRGKILRIKPNRDGSYSIPEGNLFPVGTEKTRPEIYSMGHRNPFRISVDKKTGFVYWGDVGPDASAPDSTRGPAGHDEVGQARKAGNFGWPHFVGDNKAYFKYDFSRNRSLEKWQAERPVNSSPNNTGLEVLPPAEKAFIWYPYGESKEFPLVGAGGRNAMAGPVFYSEDFKRAERPFPKYYDGKLFAYEWMRGWIMTVTMDDEGNYVSMERFMPSYRFSNPMDMEFAANGDLYMLEYGSGWFTANDDARLVRIEYNGGNRTPQIYMAANQRGGAVPFHLKLNSEGTFDADYDELSYEWMISGDNGFEETIREQNAELILDEVGTYMVNLTVDDGQGGVSTQTMEVMAGNEPPELTLLMPGSNRSFYAPNASMQYKVEVSDLEDGKIGEGINPEQVAVTIDYLPVGYDEIEIAQGHRSADESAQLPAGKKLIDASDCMACHKEAEASIGPSYMDIANKYADDDGAVDYLGNKIISGGGGVWGETAMAAHPQITEEEAAEIARYILDLIKPEEPENSLPAEGSFVAEVPAEEAGTGIYIIRAAYEDKGANGMPSIRAEESLTLRPARIDPHGFDTYADVNKMSFNDRNLAIPAKPGAYMVLNQLDLTGLTSLQIAASAPIPRLNAAGGKIEVRIGSPDGTLVGESQFMPPTEGNGFTPSILNIPIDLNTYDGAPTDLYVVFTHPDESITRPLMVVMGIEFKMAQKAVAITSAP